jgi:Ca-activated chloride channel family protein
MMMYFQEPGWLILLATIPALAVLGLRAARWRASALAAYIGGDAGDLMASARRQHTRRLWAACVGAALLVLALARPAWRQHAVSAEASGRDVVFVLDASRSMLANDVYPNRLESAKTAISDALDRLAGDRVALVVFAGSAEIQCPLTEDYSFFRMALSDAGVDTPAAGGTQIAAALTKVADRVLLPEDRGYADVILISDGGDQSPNEEAAAVKKLNDAGARLIVIGVGDKTRGSRIPLPATKDAPAQFLSHKGTDVVTRLESASLERLAKQSEDGFYFDASGGSPDLRRVHNEVLSQAPKKIRASTVAMQSDDISFVFLAAALLVLWWGWLDESPRRRGRAGAAVLLAFIVSASPVLAGETAGEAFARGNRLYAAGDYAGAQSAFLEARARRPGSPEIAFNLGDAAYRVGDYASAGQAFEEAAVMTRSPSLRARSYYNLGNSQFQQGQTSADDAATLAFYQRAIHSFRTTLEVEAASDDAAHNLEVALAAAALVQKRQEQKAAEARKQDSGEADQSDQNDMDDQDGDGENGEEGSNDQQATKDGEMSATLAGYSESRGVPPPNLSEKDILNEERRNNEERARAQRKYQNVEKDW